MKIPFQSFVPGLLAASFLTSCENPADKTTDATVSEAQKELKGEGTKFVFIDDSTIDFTGSKVTGSHDGAFKEFEGFFILDDDQVPSGGQFTIEMDSVWSDNDKLTGHLKNEDFFNVAKHPKSEFRLTKASKTDTGTYLISGNLTLNGVEKNITFPANATLEGKQAKFNAEFDINRKDFGIAYAGKADDLIRDEVVIRLNFVAESE